MSATDEFYVGAYALVKMEPTIRQANIMVCEAGHSAPWDGMPRNVNFCSVCGGKLTKGPDISVSFGRKVFPSLYDLLPENEYMDDFIDASLADGAPRDELVLLPNSRVSDRPVDIDSDEASHVEIAPHMIRWYRQNFKEQYANVLDVLKDRVKSVSVKFGVVFWYSY